MAADLQKQDALLALCSARQTLTVQMCSVVFVVAWLLQRIVWLLLWLWLDCCRVQVCSWHALEFCLGVRIQRIFKHMVNSRHKDEAWVWDSAVLLGYSILDCKTKEHNRGIVVGATRQERNRCSNQ